MSPRRTARRTASVRFAAPSFPKIDATWNFTVWSLIAQARRDRLVGKAFGEQFEHLNLARRQRLRRRFVFDVLVRERLSRPLACAVRIPSASIPDASAAASVGNSPTIRRSRSGWRAGARDRQSADEKYPHRRRICRIHAAPGRSPTVTTISRGAAAAQHAQRRVAADAIADQQVEQVFRRLDRLAVEGQDDVADQQPGARGRASRGHGRSREARRRVGRRPRADASGSVTGWPAMPR